MKSSSLSQIKIQKLQKYYFQIIIFLTFLFPSLASSDNSAFTEADFARSIQVKEKEKHVKEIWRRKLIKKYEEDFLKKYKQFKKTFHHNF